MTSLGSTLVLLRIPFSFFLMPVFWFAISQLLNHDAFNVCIIFLVLHVLIYPASNGYNSYIDKDTDSIGGIKNPPKPTKSLLYASIIFDTIGILLGIMVHWIFAIGVAVYVLVSRAYSWDGIRIKKYGWAAFFTVSFFQGAYIYLLVYLFAQPIFSVNQLINLKVLIPAFISMLNIAGVYPLTQIYQHKADKEAGVKSLSSILGITGTFYFSGIIFFAATLLTFYYFNLLNTNHLSYLLLLFMMPIVFFFTWWYIKVTKSVLQASFSNTMMMNGISATSFNLYYILLIFLKHI